MSRFCTRALRLYVLSTCLTAGTAVVGLSQPTGRIIYNLDSSEFYVGTFGPVVPQTIDRFVDEHAMAGVTDLFVNVNHKRTNYDSQVWDSGWTDLDPDSVDIEWIRNQRIFHESGFDYPELMLARARERGIGAWISIRMNDAHVPEDPAHPLHSAFWRAHPEWHLENGGLDFEVEEVRTHYLRLILEVIDRYHIDGLELDFLRFQLYFRPGREEAGTPLMTSLIEEVRSATNRAAERVGHQVWLGVRAPTSPEVSRRHGLDAIEWGTRGLVDLIVATPWWTSANSDIPVEKWKEELAGTPVEVAVSIEEGIDSGGLPRRTMTHDEMRGILLSGWSRGADAVYFFNLFTNPIRQWPRSEYVSIMKDAGFPEALAKGSRRHAVTIADPWSPSPPRALRTLPLTGTNVSMQIHIGPAPGDDRQARIELVFDKPEARPVVRIGDHQTEFAGIEAPKHLAEVGLDPDQEPVRTIYRFPSRFLEDGYNRVEIVSPDEVTVLWAEIAIIN